MDTLCDQFASLSATPQTQIPRCLEQDMQIIIDAYHKRSPFIDPSLFHLPTLFARDTYTKHHFFARYSTEMNLYKEMENEIFMRLSTIFFMELVPLIDDYIEYIFRLR